MKTMTSWAQLDALKSSLPAGPTPEGIALAEEGRKLQALVDRVWEAWKEALPAEGKVLRASKKPDPIVRRVTMGVRFM
jgi:hypothetical protein